MALAITLNVIFVTLLLVLLGATMSLPFRLPSGERVEARKRRRAAPAHRGARSAYRGPRSAERSFASD
jgi:hypothetical protein